MFEHCQIQAWFSALIFPGNVWHIKQGKQLDKKDPNNLKENEHVKGGRFPMT